MTNLEIFEAAHPDIAAWWKDSTFDFAVSLRDQVARGRQLSERQMSAARNCVARHADQLKLNLKREAEAVEVDISAVEVMLSNGKRNLLNPKVRLLGAHDQTFILSYAPAYGKNAGSIYVKNGEDYLGKISGGKFVRAGACTMLDEEDLIKSCAQPEESAVAYGQRFGICSCCGRTLTNPESIELGIGPICRENFFG